MVTPSSIALPSTLLLYTPLHMNSKSRAGKSDDNTVIPIVENGA